jgi:hypothetical protein
MKILALLLLTATIASPQEYFGYPFGRWRDPEVAKVAGQFRHRLEQKGGIALAIRRVCASDFMSPGVEAQVASNFLVERATEAYPALLDAMIKEDKAPNSDAVASCRGNLEATVRFGVCNGYTSMLGGLQSDAHPLAVARRAGARQALAKGIASGGPRAQTAMDVLLEAGNWANGRCRGLADAVQTATPVLVKWLGAPKPPPRIPGGVHSAEEKWDQALRALSFGGADRAVAEKPVRAFLADDATAPLAALALARMGVDVAAEALRMAEILDGIVLDGHGQSPKRSQQQLTLLGDVVDALVAIGRPARAALPHIAAFVARVEMPGCHTLGADRYIHLVQAIATEADANQSAAALAPLLMCQGPTEPIVRELIGLGLPARDPVLGVLRDNERPIHQRLAAADALAQIGRVSLEARDQRLIALLRAKAKGPATELELCRSEAGLPPAPIQTVPPPKEFMTCLSQYLCGPAIEVYQQTIERCCQRIAKYRTPDVCIGPGEAASTAPAKAPSPR